MLMIHLRASESRTAVDVWYLDPGNVLECRMVRTSAEFWSARKARQPYCKALFLLKLIVGMSAMSNITLEIACLRHCLVSEAGKNSLVRAEVQVTTYGASVPVARVE